MKKIFAFVFFSISIIAFAQHDHSSKSEAEIRKVLTLQQEAWNRGDLEGYMSGYWKSDSLRFIGSRGLTYGWQTTLNNYRKSYPDSSAMGKLSMEIISIEFFNEVSALVVGSWQLKRTKGDLQGSFSLIFRLLEGKWLIVFDHSS